MSISVLDTKTKEASQWGGPTQLNRYGFAVSQKKKNSNSHRERQAMSTLALEVFGEYSGVFPYP